MALNVIVTKKKNETSNLGLINSNLIDKYIDNKVNDSPAVIHRKICDVMLFYLVVSGFMCIFA